jgi:hypothetical protein
MEALLKTHLDSIIVGYILLAIGSNMPKWAALRADWKQAIYQWAYDVVMALVNRHSPPAPGADSVATTQTLQPPSR